MSLSRHWEIRESVPQWACLLLAGFVGIIAFVLIPFVLEAVAERIWEPNYVACLGIIVGSERAALGVLVLIDAVAAYVLGRSAFTRLRWRMVWRAAPYCDGCGYDLTGNVSGVCPECGLAVPGLASDTESLSSSHRTG